MIKVIMLVEDQQVIDWEVGGDSVPSVIFDLAVDNATLAADIAEYDPNSGTSPSVTVARKYARVLFDAYLAAQQQQGGG